MAKRGKHFTIDGRVSVCSHKSRRNLTRDHVITCPRCINSDEFFKFIVGNECVTD